MARTRTTKKLAQRIDLNYFKRPSRFKRAKFWLSVLVPVLALLWIIALALGKDSRAYSSGRMSEPHAVLENQCAACHIQKAGQFSASAEDTACLSCHDGPVHHANQTSAPNCASCHNEHRGRINLVATRNENCSACHADLRAHGGGARFASAINSFEDGHPQFAVLKEGARDPGTIKLNHSLHLKPIRRSPNGPNVQLACVDCHRPANTTVAWPYADAKYVAAKVSYTEPVSAAVPNMLSPNKPLSGREFLAPPKFATACASCHLLTFDKRFDDGVPHDKPEVVHAFLVKKFTDYIAAHPSELREMRDPDRDLTGKAPIQRTQSLTSSQWIAQRVAVSEQLLWHKTCAQCHSMSMTPLGDVRIARWSPSITSTPASSSSSSSTSSTSSTSFTSSTSLPLPSVAPSNITTRWMPHAKFSHDAHHGFTCESCHQKALSSTETSDVLLPGIAACQTCHAPGPDRAESRCFECHTYHDWSKRKEVTPKFTLPALRTGGK